jgi:hypothetical protein
MIKYDTCDILSHIKSRPLTNNFKSKVKNNIGSPSSFVHSVHPNELVDIINSRPRQESAASVIESDLGIGV